MFCKCHKIIVFSCFGYLGKHDIDSSHERDLQQLLVQLRQRVAPGQVGRFTGPTPLSLGHLDTRCPSVWKLVHQTCGLATLGRVHS